MNLRDEKWHARLESNSGQNTVTLQGSLLTVTRQMLEILQGAKKVTSITLRVGLTPITSDQVQPLDSALDMALMGEGRQADETTQGCFDRLIADGYGEEAARVLVADWFGLKVEPTLLAWMADADMIRLRELTCNSRAFAEALPSEYRQLVAIGRLKYPDMLANLTLRMV